MTETEWLECTDPQRLLNHHCLRSNRKLRLFACASCHRIDHLLADEQSQKAIECAERFADGLARKSDLSRARSEVERVARDHAWTSDQRAPFNAAWNACRGNAGNAATQAARIAAVASARNALKSEIGLNTIDQATFDSERLWQTVMLRDIANNPYRTVSIDPVWGAWNDCTILKIAEAIYVERAYDRLPILADALEDAGCDNADILTHCRSEGPHVRGCWVVDLLLGKE